MLVALGATQELESACEVLSYEAPFGVGYLVAQLTDAKSGKTVSSASVSTEDSENFELPALARKAVETFVRTGDKLIPPDATDPLLAARAACFVSIKTHDGNLRGCIGTIEPVKHNLAQELIANAINAATRDPRFEPVAADELAQLRYSVDVLAAPSRPNLKNSIRRFTE